METTHFVDNKLLILAGEKCCLTIDMLVIDNNDKTT